MTLTQKILAAANDALHPHGACTSDFAELLPLITALADVASAAELNASAQHGHGYAIHLVTTLEALDDALERLRAQIGGCE